MLCDCCGVCCPDYVHEGVWEVCKDLEYILQDTLSFEYTLQDSLSSVYIQTAALAEL